MNKKISKIISLFLCLAMVLGCFPFVASAADTTVSTNGNGGKTDVGAWYTTYNTDAFWGDNGRFSDPSTAKVGYKALRADGSYGVPYSHKVSEIDFQIKKMAEAGIDFIVFDLTNGGLSQDFNYGTGDNLSFIINNAKLTCERISAWNDTHSWKIRYAVSVGVYTNLRLSYVGDKSGMLYTESIGGKTAATVGLAAELQAAEVLNQFVNNETYGDDYYKLDNKPLLVLHDTGSNLPTSQMALYFGEKDNLSQFTVRDSVSKAQAGTYGWYTSGSVADNNNCGAVADDEVMLVSPGQVNHAGGNNTPNAYREDGEHYKANWDAVLANSPRIVMISSLNDYMEDTAIWPTVTSSCVAEEKWQSPYQYWNLTVDYINDLRTANGDTATTAAERSGNVALGATVAANDALAAYPVSRLTDGLIDYDRTTETTGITRYNSNGIGYFEVALGTSADINQVKVFRTTWEADSFPKDIAIDVKNASGSWKRVAEMHDIEAKLPHDLTFNFATVTNATIIRVSANKARNSSSNFRVSEIEAYNTTLTADDYTGVVKDATYNIPEMRSDNLLLGKIATCTAGRTTGTLSNLTDGKYKYRADGDVTCTYAHVTYGAYNSDTLADHSAYFEYSFDEATRLNSVKLYLCSVETNQWARDVAIDVQLEDGTWQRVSADYNIKYGSTNVGGTYYEDSPVTQAYMQYNFAPVDCLKLRITSNRKRMRINKGLTGSTCVFRLAEIQAFYDPSITTYSGVERPDQADYAVPIELANYAAGGTVTTKGINPNGIANLTDGSKSNRGISYNYTTMNPGSTPTNDQTINYYDITFKSVKEIDRVDVIYSLYATDEIETREHDISVDVITPDGRFVRVAEKHDYWDAENATNNENLTLSLTFDTIEAAGIRVSVNCKESQRYRYAASGKWSKFYAAMQVYAEIEAYNDPNVISNTGIENVVVAGTEIPLYKSKNYAVSGTITSTNTNASLNTNYPVSKLINGSKDVSSDCGIINYVNNFAAYEIAFDGVKTVNQVKLFLSQYEKEKLPVDMVVYAMVNGSWKRVAEMHNIDYTGVTSLTFNFAQVNATAIKVRATNTTNTSSDNFRLVEIETYFDPNITKDDYSELSYGDVNDDVVINSKDLIAVKKSLLLDEEPNFDVNNDGVSNILDLVRLKKILVGLA